MSLQMYRGLKIVERNEHGIVHLEALDSSNNFFCSGDDINDIRNTIDEILDKPE